MSDVVIFCMGCLVSLFVASAVGLLLWGASNEPRGSVLPTSSSTQPGSYRPTPLAPASARSLNSKSPT